jgi:hypothetical protein
MITMNWFANPVSVLLDWYEKRSNLQLRIADCYRHQNQAPEAVVFLKKSICMDNFSSYLPNNRVKMMAWFPKRVTRNGKEIPPAFQGYYASLERAACSIQVLYRMYVALRVLWQKRLSRKLVCKVWHRQLCRRMLQRRRIAHKLVGGVRDHIWLHVIIPKAKARAVMDTVMTAAVRKYIHGQAAIKIQTLLRNRHMFKILSAATLKTQSLWRGCSCRAAFRRACVKLYREFNREKVRRVQEAVKDEG